MQKTCTWLLALAGVLGVVGTTHAGTLPLIPLCLPGLFGQDLPSTTSRGTPPPTVPDSDWLADSVDLLMEYAPQARVLVQSLRPCTPYHIAAAAVLEYLAAVDAAQQDAVPGTVAVPPASGPWTYEAREVRSCPQTGSCPLTSSNPYIVTEFVGPDGQRRRFITPCAGAPCCKPDGCCNPCPGNLHHVADACCNSNGGICCQAVVQVSATTKPCKCCEQCKDCKDCSCAKSAVKTTTCPVTGVVVMKRDGSVGPTPIALPPVPMPSPYAPLAMPYPLPHPMMPLPPLPPSPLDELRALHMQQQMILAAIEQVDHEMAQIEMHRHVMLPPPLPGAHPVNFPVHIAVERVMCAPAPSSQKVHLATEHFEAHCNALHCVNGDPHRVVLEGDVRLSCKKGGQSVHIEAPRVIVNMRDGTFVVESLKSMTTSMAPAPVFDINMLSTPPAAACNHASSCMDCRSYIPLHPAITVVQPCTSMPAMPPWMTGMPVPIQWHPPLPAESLPMPCPVGPVCPARATEHRDK
jgi:hypothetical protein